MVYKKIERIIHNFQSQKVVEGILVEKVQSQFKGQDYILDIAGQGRTVVFGKTALQARMQDVKLGSKIKIEFKGKVKSKAGQEYDQFDVYIDQ